MASRFKCPLQKLAFEISEDSFHSSEKYKKIVLEHYFNHTVCSLVQFGYIWPKYRPGPAGAWKICCNWQY